MKTIKYVICLIGFICFTGCAKKAPDGDQSRIVLQMPQKMGVGGLSGSDCFAVNIKAENLIKAGAGTCDPSYGDFAGLVPAGSQLELETVPGKNRTIEIFFIQSSTSCQKGFDPKKGLSKVFGSNRVYLIAQKKGVDLKAGEQKIEIEIQNPEERNSFAELYNFPTSCEKDPINLRVVNQARIVQGEYRGTTDAGLKVHIRVRDQKMDSPVGATGTKLKPLRLGVTNE